MEDTNIPARNGVLLLDPEHRRLGARMGIFSGWEMPIRYTSTIKEHLHVRRQAGLFDISHMGRIFVSSEGTLGETLDVVGPLVSGGLEGLQPGQAAYTLLLNEEGGIMDDLIAYCTETGLLLILNAARTSADREWLGAHLPRCKIHDLTMETCLFALQGPEALPLLSTLGEGSIVEMKPFTHKQTALGDIMVGLMRTGYTGERGAELMVSREKALDLWRMIMQARHSARVLPCGLGARDTLRLEAGLLLHGQDITESMNPFSAGLDRFVDLDRPSFIGKEALLRMREKDPDRVLAGFVTRARIIPRSGDPIDASTRQVGKITSGAYSPVLRLPVALGYIPPGEAAPGTRLTVRSHRGEIPVEVADLPFYRRGRTPLPEEEM